MRLLVVDTVEQFLVFLHEMREDTQEGMVEILQYLLALGGDVLFLDGLGQCVVLLVAQLGLNQIVQILDAFYVFRIRI